MKEFLNKLKTPTKILSIVCFVLVIMLFRKCNEANRSRDKCNGLRDDYNQLTKQIITKDSTIYENEIYIRVLGDSIKDLNFKSVVDKGYTMEGKHDAEIKLAKCEKDNLRIANENNNLQRVINNLKKELEDCKKSK